MLNQNEHAQSDRTHTLIQQSGSHLLLGLSISQRLLLSGNAANTTEAG